MEIHPSQRRFSCGLCRRNKAKCQRIRPDDPKCLRYTLANVLCDSGEQKKVGRPKRKELSSSSTVVGRPLIKRREQATKPKSQSKVTKESIDHNKWFTQNPPEFPGTCEAFTLTQAGRSLKSYGIEKRLGPLYEPSIHLSTSMTGTGRQKFLNDFERVHTDMVFRDDLLTMHKHDRSSGSSLELAVAHTTVAGGSPRMH
jgi:hypothetical protein